MDQTQFIELIPEITTFFNTNGRSVLSLDDLFCIIEENTANWKLPKRLGIRNKLELLLNNIPLKRHDIGFPSRKFIRYCWGNFSIYKLASSLVNNSYFTHSTALLIPR